METYKKLKNSGKSLFSTKDLQSLLGITVKRTLENNIKRLIKYKFLISLEKGKYLFSENSYSTFDVAQYMYNPSYISLETALNYHGILSQFPFEITSVTTKKPVKKEVEGKVYSYAKINKGFFFGYEKVENSLIASPEKALFDYLYFISKGLRSESYLDELDLSKLNKKRFQSFAGLVKKNGKLYKMIRRFK